MVLTILRALFVLLMAAAGWYLLASSTVLREYTGYSLAVTLAFGVLIICVDILAPRSKLQLFSGTFFGLFVGLLITYALSFVVKLILPQYFEMIPRTLSRNDQVTLEFFVNLILGLVCCYLCISFVLQTKDDFRFVVPYVELKRQAKGAHPIVLDTSVLIDGRVHDVAATGIIQHRLFVPQFVVDELHALADSADKHKRGRGRRGLDMLAKLQNLKSVDLVIYDSSVHGGTEQEGVDQKLISLAKQLDASVLTTDFNLNKVAQLHGVNVINLNDLASALRPVVLPGEKMVVNVQKPGEGTGQGVGYLEDGTMVVLEQARDHIGEDVEFTVTKLHHSSAGRMIFGRVGGDAPIGPPRRQPPRTRTDSTSSPA
jgi:uncharacterized protein YacL